MARGITGRAFSAARADNALGAPLFVIRIDVDSAVAGTFDSAVGVKCRVIDCIVLHKSAGESSDTITLSRKRGSTVTAISNAMDFSGSDKALVRAGALDDALTDLEPADVLRITTVDDDTDGDAATAIVHVLCVRLED
jgi:predicted short-subunit dehydrogenase-like oxidoreductase (DUF2520 family)